MHCTFEVTTFTIVEDLKAVSRTSGSSIAIFAYITSNLNIYMYRFNLWSVERVQSLLLAKTTHSPATGLVLQQTNRRELFFFK